MDNLKIFNDELTLIRLVSSAGGAHDALENVVKQLRKRSGEEFAAGNDVKAKLLREMANEFEVLRCEASKELRLRRDDLDVLRNGKKLS